MTRKQCGIIFTLLALILCCGMLAAKLNNGGLNDPTDLSQVFTAEADTSGLNNNNDDKDKKEVNTENNNDADSYFYESRSNREQDDSIAIQSWKAIIADANTSKEQKDEATKMLNAKTMSKDNEARIELQIKNKGFDDAFCTIQNNKATVTIKSPTGLEQSDSVAIQEIVQDVSNIKDVIIEVQK